MGVLTKWASTPEPKENILRKKQTEPLQAEIDKYIILKVDNNKIRIERELFIKKLEKAKERELIKFINVFEAEEVSIEKDDILKIMK